VELGVTERYHTLTADVKVFAGSPIRLLTDNSVPIAICAFKEFMTKQNYSEAVFEAVQQANFSISEVLKLLLTPFGHSFQVGLARGR
jgi:tRNA A37 threonylcarbamoyltransferase TsaD